MAERDSQGVSFDSSNGLELGSVSGIGEGPFAPLGRSDWQRNQRICRAAQQSLCRRHTGRAGGTADRSQRNTLETENGYELSAWGTIGLLGIPRDGKPIGSSEWTDVLYYTKKTFSEHNSCISTKSGNAHRQYIEGQDRSEVVFSWQGGEPAVEAGFYRKWLSWSRNTRNQISESRTIAVEGTL